MVALTPPAPPDRLAPLRSPRAASGFGCVYKVSGSRRWRAPVGKRLNLDNPAGGKTFPTAAAAAVADYYRGRLGDRWPEVFRRRTANQWVVRRVVRAEAVAGFVADLYKAGVPARLTAGMLDPRCPRAQADADLWPSQHAARQAVRAYTVRELGPDYRRRLRGAYWRA